MKHNVWLDQLPYYAAGALPLHARAALEHHLAGCGPCRVALREWQVIAQAVRSDAASRVKILPALRPLPSEYGPLSRNGRLMKENTRMLNPAVPHPFESRAPVYTLAAALLLVILLGGVLFAIATRDGKLPAGAPGGDQPSGAGQVGGTATPTALPTLVPVLTMTPTATYFPPTSSQVVEISATPTPTAWPPPVVPVDVATATPTPTAWPPDSLGTPTPIPVTVRPDGSVDGELESLPPAVKLEGIRYEAQEWNNSSPANLAMALSYWGWTGDQSDTARWLKPNSEDKSVAAWQMVYYANRFTDQKAIYRMGGTTHLMKQLLAAGFPVIIETGFQPDGEDWMGHHLLLTGYDDSQEVFLTYDSFLGNNQGDGRPVPYSVLDENWRHFSRTFIVVYDPARERDLRPALGAYVDPAAGASAALEAARADVSIHPDDAWGWFSMGTAYVALGEYENAVVAYDQAIQLGLPWRTLWYQFGPYEAYFHMEVYDNVLALADNTLATTEYVEETYFWKGMALGAEGDADAAGEQFAEVIRLNRNFFTALSEYVHLDLVSFKPPPQMNPMNEYSNDQPSVILLTPTVVPLPDSAIATAVPVTIITATPILVPPDAPPDNAIATAVPVTIITVTPILVPPDAPTMSPGERAFRTETALIPGGTFMMGTTLDEAQAAMDECAVYDKTCDDTNWVADSTPPHPVTVNSFQMEIYEVPVEYYALFLNWLGPGSHTNGCQGRPCALTTVEEPDSSYITFDGTTYAVRDLEQYSDYPVTMVTWWGAQAYCQAIGRRLPTEAEWEHAARGDRNYIYPWGFDFDSGRARTAIRTPDGPVQVDSYPLGVSPFGIFHMAGNVSEWVADWYDASYYAQLLEDPITAENPRGPMSGNNKVHRGGSWDTLPIFVRSVQRMSLAPTEASASVGFRCAADTP